MKQLSPMHPGKFIKTEILDAHKLTITDAAEALGVSRPTLSTLVNGHSDLTGEMALRIEKAFGVKMDTLVQMQTNYDIAQIRKRASSIRVERFAVA
jgi:addiction module HigA family antidote